MLTEISETIRRYSMLEPGERVLCGLSGGADSVTLVHSLHTLGYDVHAVHINHMIRGEEAERDMSFAENFCKSIDVPFEAYRIDVPKLAEKNGLGLEECGRNERYRVFFEVSERLGCKIATAHTLSDSAETVLFNLARGSSITGMCGIPAVRDNIIRPLISSTRAEIEEYCRDNGLEYVTDSTNKSTEYTRNMIRLEVIPRLEKINSGAVRAIGRLSECASSDDAYLFDETHRWLCEHSRDGKCKASELYMLPAPLRRRALSIISCGCDSRHISIMENMLCKESGAVQLSAEKTAVVSGGMFFIRTEQMPVDDWSMDFFGENVVLPDGRCFSCDLVTPESRKKSEIYHNLVFTQSIDYDIITDKLKNGLSVTLRNYRQGDRFSPCGRGLSKPLRKLFNEKKIPVEKRRSLVIMECGGEIIWVENFGAAQGVAASKSSGTILMPKII